MTTPAFLADVEQDERAELEAALGVSLTPPPDATDAARDAYVSDLLRALGETEADERRIEETMKLEIARIEARYEQQLARCGTRAELLRAAIHAEAMAADFGRKKSRDVGYGTYGRKQVPERVAVTDKDAVLEWAHTHRSSLISERIEQYVSHLTMKAYFHETGDMPPGVEITPAHDEPYAKPLVTP